MLMFRLPSLWNEMNRLHDAFARQALQLAYAPARRALAPSYPPVNVWEDDGCVYAEAELAGVKPEEVEVFVTDNTELTIKGQRKADELPQGAWHLRERGFGSFERVLTLPAPVEADKVEARFECGVLKVRLPKAEAARPKRIPVTSSQAPALEHSPAPTKGGDA